MLPSPEEANQEGKIVREDEANQGEDQKLEATQKRNGSTKRIVRIKKKTRSINSSGKRRSVITKNRSKRSKKTEVIYEVKAVQKYEIKT